MTENQETRCTICPSNSFWLHYLSLERSLLEISEYIAINKDNFQCYSFKNMQLFFAICSEIDSIFKHIQRNVYSDITSVESLNIVKNIIMLREVFPIVKETTITTNIDGSVIEFKPFEELFSDYLENNNNNKAKPRSWWQQYNDVKHQRLDNFDNANLKNLLESLSALHILNLIYALSLESKSVENYEAVLIQASANRQYPILQLTNSGVRSYAGGGSGFYAGFLTNEYLPEYRNIYLTPNIQKLK